MNNYAKFTAPKEARVELHDNLGLTGAEISINTMPAGANVPFVHHHKNNEEVYAILSGRGTMTIDGQPVELQAGDWLRVSPAAKRQLSAAPDSEITYLCIQTKENSLDGFTLSDGVID